MSQAQQTLYAGAGRLSTCTSGGLSLRPLLNSTQFKVGKAERVATLASFCFLCDSEAQRELPPQLFISYCINDLLSVSGVNEGGPRIRMWRACCRP